MNLTAFLGIDTSKWQTGLKQAESQSDATFNRINAQMSKTDNYIKRLENSMKSGRERLSEKLQNMGATQGQINAVLGRYDYAEKLKAQIAATKQLQAAEQKRLETLKTIGATIKTAFVGAFAIGGVRGLTELADGYTQMTARIRNVTSSTEELEYVQKRLSENTKSTYRSLSEAADSYLNISGSLKAVGYNTKEILDFNDSLTYAFTANATSSDKATAAISALSKSFATGKIDAKAWSSILLAVPEIAKDIATELNLSEEEIRKMGVEGKISVDTLVTSLSKAKDKNKELADSMSISLKDGFQYFKNALMEYVGTANNANGITDTLAQGIKFLGDNIDYLAKATALFLGYKAFQYFRMMTAAVIAKTAAVGKSILAFNAETMAIAANTKALTVNAAARNLPAIGGGVGKLGGLANMGKMGGAVAGGVGAMLGGGAMTGLIALFAAGLVSAGETFSVALGKQSETTASKVADAATRFISKMFGDGQSLSLGDAIYRNLTKAGREETRRYEEENRRYAEIARQKMEAENALSGDYRNLRAGLSGLGEEIAKQTEQLDKTTISMQLAEKRLSLTKIKESGKDSPDAIAKLEKELADLQAKNQENINKAATDYIKSLQEQNTAIGKTSEELEILKLSTQGVSKELLQQAKLQQEINKQRQNEQAVQDKIKDLLEQSERYGKTDRQLFELDVSKLTGNNTALLKEALAAWDKNENLKAMAELQKQAAEEFSGAVDTFSGSLKENQGLSDFERRWEAEKNMLAKMNDLQKQEYFKQQQLALPSYSSLTSQQLDQKMQQAADELEKIYQKIDQNRIAAENQRQASLAIQMAAGTQGLDITDWEENFNAQTAAQTAQTTAIQENTAALQALQLQQTQQMQQNIETVSKPQANGVAMVLKIVNSGSELAQQVVVTPEFYSGVQSVIGKMAQMA